MDEIILHHYPLSLFSEKVRRILAYKGLPWRSVEQPMMAPKPELTPLTGGYRRLPVLQIGADVYCDSACIARRLERLRPDPPCFPPGPAAVAGLIEDWADHRFAFQILPPAVADLLPDLPPDILDDRAKMSPTLSKEALLGRAPHALTQALVSLDRLDELLRDRAFVTGTPSFLLGDTFSIADAACFHPIWFLRTSPKLFEAVAERPALADWFARIEALGPGDVKPMSAAEALAIAQRAMPGDLEGGDHAPVAGLAIGDAVTITADDYGTEQTRGTIARWTAEEIAIRRDDPALGEMAVHFPRSGYRIEQG